MSTHMVIISDIYYRVLFEIFPWSGCGMWYLQARPCIYMPTRTNGQEYEILIFVGNLSKKTM